MQTLINPAELLAQSITARCAALLGDPVRTAFPTRESLERASDETRARIGEGMAWVRPLLSAGSLSLEADGPLGWSEAVRVAVRLGGHPALGGALFRRDEDPEPEQVSDRLVRALSRSSGDALLQIAVDNQLDQVAGEQSGLVVRAVHDSRLTRLERALSTEIARAQISVPKGEDLTTCADVLRDQINEAGDAIGLADLEAGTAGEPGGTIRRAFDRLHRATTDYAQQADLPVDSAIVSLCAIPSDISMRCAEAALHMTTRSRPVAPRQQLSTLKRTGLCLYVKPFRTMR